MNRPLQLNLGLVSRVLVSIVVLVSSLGLWADLCSTYLYKSDTRPDWVEFFSLSFEQNLPTWVSSLLLFTAGIQLFIISKIRIQSEFMSLRFAFLGFLFFYISLDEFTTLHENANSWFDLDGIFYFGWVIPAGIIVTTLAIVYLPFLQQLPADSAKNFLLSGILYVGGALLVELLLGYWSDRNGIHNVGYSLIDWVEETLELSGVAFFNYSLMSLIHKEGSLTIRLSRSSR